LLVGSSALQGCAPRLQGIREELEAVEPLEDLAFDDITLQQADDDGKPLWSLTADRATYQQDASIAQVEQPDGVIFQQGVTTYTVRAETGQIYDDGKRIVLSSNVVVSHVPKNALLQGDELEWFPEEDRLILRRNLAGTYKDLTLKAEELQFNGQTNQVTLAGSIEAVMTDSQVRLQTDGLLWFIDEARITSDRPVLLEHFEAANPPQVIDRATGDGLAVDLASQRSTLQPNALVNLGQPAFDIRSDSLTWDAKANVVEANKPVTIVNRIDQTTMAAQQGVMDLVQRVVTLTGQVQGQSPPQQATLTADRLIWNLTQNQVDATGNVFYGRSSPVLQMSGSRAIGNLNEETLKVTGDQPVKTVYMLE